MPPQLPGGPDTRPANAPKRNEDNMPEPTPATPTTPPIPHLRAADPANYQVGFASAPSHCQVCMAPAMEEQVFTVHVRGRRERGELYTEYTLNLRLCPECQNHALTFCQSCREVFYQQRETRLPNGQICSLCATRAPFSQYVNCTSCNMLHPRNYTACREYTPPPPQRMLHAAVHHTTPSRIPMWITLNQGELRVDPRAASGRRYFGMELETNWSDSIGETEALEALYSRLERPLGRTLPVGLVKADGSIGRGGEIITYPATLPALYRIINLFWQYDPATPGQWEAMPGIRSYRRGTCGFHVHVSRSSIASATLRHLLVMINDPANEAFISMVAQRRATSYCRRQQKRPDDVYLLEPQDRYEAINLCNEHTVEFRIFRASFRPDRVYKNLEFCQAALEFCASETGYNNLTHSRLASYIHDHRETYPHLAAYLTEHWTTPTPPPTRAEDEPGEPIAEIGEPHDREDPRPPDSLPTNGYIPRRPAPQSTQEDDDDDPQTDNLVTSYYDIPAVAMASANFWHDLVREPGSSYYSGTALARIAAAQYGQALRDVYTRRCHQTPSRERLMIVRTSDRLPIRTWLRGNVPALPIRTNSRRRPGQTRSNIRYHSPITATAWRQLMNSARERLTTLFVAMRDERRTITGINLITAEQFARTGNQVNTTVIYDALIERYISISYRPTTTPIQPINATQEAN